MLNFLDRFFEKPSYSKKINPMEAELFHADGQTAMTKLTVALRNFFENSLKRLTRWRKKYMIIIGISCANKKEI